MKRLIWFPVLLVFLFLIMGFLGCSEDPGSTNTSTVSAGDQKVIEQNIDIFIKAQYQAMIDRKTEELQRTLADVVVSPEQARGIAKVADAIAEGAALDNKPYKFFQTRLQFNHEKDQLTENRAQVSVTESTKLGLGSITSDSVLEHLVILEQKGKDWKIAEDRILNLPGSPNLEDSSSFDEPTQFSQPERNLAPTGTTYQRYWAAAYARTWANSYNPAYRKWTSGNADCANFVSQSVYYGCWPMTSGFDWKSPTAWWYNNVYGMQTYTWTGADYLFRYVIMSNRGWGVQESQVKPGDILAIDYEGDSKIDHVMIFSGKDSSKGLLLCGHTTARLDIPLNPPANPNVKDEVRKTQGHPNAVFIYLRLYDAF